MSQGEIQTRPSTGLLIWMILSQILAVASIVIWYPLVGLLMMFGSGSGNWGLVIVFYPVFVCTMIWYVWTAYSYQKYSLAAISSGVLIAPVVLLGLIAGIIMTVNKFF